MSGVGNVHWWLLFQEFILSVTNKDGLWQVLKNGSINLTFRRNFGEEEQEEWDDLRRIVENMALNAETDSVRWVFEKSGLFTTASLYRELTFPGVPNRWMMNIWNAKLPLKIRMFLWQVCNNKIQSADQLDRKNWKGPTECKLCGQYENT
jgi:hypothetical protein